MAKSFSHSAGSSPVSIEAPARHEPLIDPSQLRFSGRWISAGATLGPLAMLGVWQGGAPVAAALGLAGAAGAAYARLIEPASPRCEHVTLHVPTLPPELEGLRIGHLSDLHLGTTHAADNTHWAIQKLMEVKPDLVVLTGDFVSYTHAIPEITPLLQPLRAPLGMYAVPGNHDYLEGMPAVTSTLARLGIEMLINEHRLLHWRGGSLALLGVDDMWYGKPDLDAALAGVPSSAFPLLLAHAPDFADEAAQRRIPMQLSGHTHGGQLRLPLLGPFCLPLYGLRYACGLEQVGPVQLYVSRGVGGVSLRFGCPPEATILTLTQA